MECIVFSGYLDRDGYGQVKHEGKAVLAHRLAYCDAQGVGLADIAALVVRHTCDNPSCINPLHLLIGTQADNMADRSERGRAKGQPSGEANTKAKLTAEQVLEIRQRYKPRDRLNSYKAIADDYGLTTQAVYYIIKRKTWSQL